MSPANDDVMPGGADPAPPAPPGQMWDDWPPSTSPLVTEFPGKAELAWSLTGRRVSVSGTGQGVSAVEIDGRRIASAIRLEIGGHPPDTVLVRLAPDEVVRVLQAGEIQLTERITTALEHPLVFWSLVADAPVELALGWRDDEVFTATVLAAAGEVRLSAGAVEITGDRLLRVVLAAGSDGPELERVLETLRRRKLRAFRQDRILHARRLGERLVSLESPDPMLDRRFGWAKVELDGRLEERPGRGRFVAREAVRTGRALLAAGDREVVRDLIGAFQAHPMDEGSAAPLGLIDAWLRWTGELDPLARRWPDLAALAERQASRLAPGVRDGLVAAARAAGAGASADRLAAVRATGPADGHPHIELTGFGADPAGLVSGVVETLWGVEPDLIGGVVRVAPGLPRGWSEMALRRLRVGPTFFDLRVRRRPERTVLTVRRASGPPIRLRAALQGDRGRGPVTVDQAALGGRDATFLVEDVHEVTFHDD